MLLCLKQATITKLLKRSDLDKENLKNYHPISNLSFISKLIENVVARRIEYSYQSAYYRGHSAETEALDEVSMTTLIIYLQL